VCYRLELLIKSSTTGHSEQSPLDDLQYVRSQRTGLPLRYGEQMITDGGCGAAVKYNVLSGKERVKKLWCFLTMLCHYHMIYSTDQVQAMYMAWGNKVTAKTVQKPNTLHNKWNYLTRSVLLMETTPERISIWPLPEQVVFVVIGKNQGEFAAVTLSQYQSSYTLILHHCDTVFKSSMTWLCRNQLIMRMSIMKYTQIKKNNNIINTTCPSR
jgi:hypothetical protein